jgi:hypothetical protein
MTKKTIAWMLALGTAAVGCQAEVTDPEQIGEQQEELGGVATLPLPIRSLGSERNFAGSFQMYTGYTISKGVRTAISAKLSLGVADAPKAPLSIFLHEGKCARGGGPLYRHDGNAVGGALRFDAPNDVASLHLQRAYDVDGGRARSAVVYEGDSPAGKRAACFDLKWVTKNTARNAPPPDASYLTCILGKDDTCGDSRCQNPWAPDLRAVTAGTELGMCMHLNRFRFRKALRGSWQTKLAPVSGPNGASAYMRQRVFFTEWTEELRAEVFFDAAGQKPFFTYRSIGPYEIPGSVKEVPGAFEFDATNDSATITLHVAAPALVKALGFDDCKLQVGRAVDVSNGCASPPFTDAGCVDHDILAIIDGKLRFGAPGTDRCKESGRPDKLGPAAFEPL